MGFDVDKVLAELKQNDKIALLSGELYDHDLCSSLAHIKIQASISGTPSRSQNTMYLQYA
jgi:hypothetical protein